MLVPNQKVEVRWNPRNKKYYERIGYVFTKMGDKIDVPIEKLPDNSSAFADVICDSCGKEYRIISDNGVGYPISEEDEGTTIYSPRVINLINYMDKLENIDYIVMNSVIGKIEEFDEMVDKFIKREKIDDDTYLGFLNVKTIYKLK